MPSASRFRLLAVRTFLAICLGATCGTTVFAQFESFPHDTWPASPEMLAQPAPYIERGRWQGFHGSGHTFPLLHPFSSHGYGKPWGHSSHGMGLGHLFHKHHSYGGYYEMPIESYGMPIEAFMPDAGFGGSCCGGDGGFDSSFMAPGPLMDHQMPPGPLVPDPHSSGMPGSLYQPGLPPSGPIPTPLPTYDAAPAPAAEPIPARPMPTPGAPPSRTAPMGTGPTTDRDGNPPSAATPAAPRATIITPPTQEVEKIEIPYDPVPLPQDAKVRPNTSSSKMFRPVPGAARVWFAQTENTLR